MKTSKPRLVNAEPHGRVDVLMYRFVERIIDRVGQEQGVDLRQLLPILEEAIAIQVPAQPIPQEFLNLLRASEVNRGRSGRVS